MNWVLLSIFILIAPEASAMECSLNGFAALCAKIPASTESFITLPSGRKMLNPRRLEKNPVLKGTASQQRAADVFIHEKFEWVRNQIILQITQGLPEDRLKPVQKSFLARIRSVKVSVQTGICKAHSDRYDSGKNEVSICYTNALMSDAQLIGLLAHEMTHSIDGCLAQCNQYRRIGPINVPSTVVLRQEDKNILSAYQSSSSFVFDQGALDGGASDPLVAALGDWEKKGLVTVESAAIAPGEHPFASALTCMVQQNLVTPNISTIGEGEACREGTNSETPSDMWGGLIAGKYLQEHPLTSDLEKIASLADRDIDLMCAPRRGPKPLRALNDPALLRRLPTNSRYFDDRFRTEALFLSNTNVQKAFGCDPIPKYNKCANQFEQTLHNWGNSNTTPPADSTDVEQ
jgi:hypothetical protein